MRIIYLISFLLFPLFSRAQTTSKSVSVVSSYAVDQNSSWTIDLLQQQKFHAFKQNDKINIGYNRDAAVWCRFIVKNVNTSQSTKTWLCFNNNHIDSLSLYDGKVIKTIGDRTVGKSPFIETLAFELNLQPNEERLVWVRVKKVTSYLDLDRKSVV